MPRTLTGSNIPAPLQRGLEHLRDLRKQKSSIEAEIDQVQDEMMGQMQTIQTPRVVLSDGSVCTLVDQDRVKILAADDGVAWAIRNDCVPQLCVLSVSKVPKALREPPDK